MSFQRFSGVNALEKRRTLEEERKSRILDDRSRGMGIDVAVLDAQVAEKNRIRQHNKELDDLYNNQMNQLDEHCCAVQKEVNEFRRQREKEDNNFRMGYQRKEQRREWDLQDPKRLVKEPPTRLGDVDPRLGASSIQVFGGEDVNWPTRKKAMQEQVRTWTQQQVDEKDVRKWAQYENDRQFAERDEEMNYKAHQMAKGLADERKRIAIETAYFNKSLSEQQKMEAHRNKFREQQVNMAEIQQALDSDMLTENPMATLNAQDATRFKNDHMKGLLSHQRQAIMDEQSRQRRELAERRQAAAAEERAWDTLQHQQTRNAILLDRQRARESRSKIQALSDERRQQAFEAAERHHALKKLYSNDIGEEFQGKFGSSIR
jgi:hypothetical protein|uniref:RIB43A-like with coiled-coils protein 2 n=1 Tax=Eutreptiella gymnastica TaxID=73025 RepID=A0A7S4LAG2_9EUGL|eukprot:CAMPEP_0174285742 /NCGR_PEP_ID=MMETSP0809-20121228/9589_1 /TAXON_ID=73025 ORGANISM="Eutreptiella gymnastica-like, Strain CCMP1594" /NCGR_SAMPLE_ID=MMETSP0809 /ASSEMBLY_ACC=CAM_ASM_000658 /LENGTH=374 /DNA_ID=CAMNT_0015381591 /DNA_START=21 /DNA_END=1145 /DNA_ORIENTATION=+